MINLNIPMPAGLDSTVCDPLTGIVHRCFEMPLDPDDARLFCYVSEATRSQRLAPGNPACPVFGCGVDETREGARGAAMGEVLERYSATLSQPEIRHATYEELRAEGLDAIAPDRFALYTEAQYQEFDRQRPQLRRGDLKLPERFAPDSPAGWVEGFHLGTRRPAWVPAPFALFPYDYEAGEPYLLDSSSTGLACATSGTEALLKALYEVVERDSLTILWHAALELPSIPLEGALADLYEERIAAPGLSCHLLDATLDTGIPTVMALLLDERGGSIIGSCTRLDAQEAARKALLEAAQGRIVWRRELAAGIADARYEPGFRDVWQYSDHPRIYMDPAMQSQLDFLYRSPQRRSLSDLPQLSTGTIQGDLEVALERLATVGLEPIAFDMTLPDIEIAGYRVVRAVVPEMLAINARHILPPLGSQRLREVPVRTGFASSPLTEGDLHTTIHPFA
ncbi:MAG: YcaO-like family protein [Acidobacteriota bacterium]